MITIKVATNGENLIFVEKPTIASGDKNTVKLDLIFCDCWKDYSITAVFNRQGEEIYYEKLLVNNSCIVPAEVLTKAGNIQIALKGVKADGSEFTSERLNYKIIQGAVNGTVEDPTPDIYHQILSAYGDISDEFNNINEDILGVGNRVNLLENYVTPQMFGAKADGITDNTNSIQNAINYLFNNGGGTLIIPPSEKEYIITSIDVKENVIIKGIGGILKVKDNYCVDETQKYYIIHNLNGNGNVSLIDLIIDGNKDKNTKYVVADTITMGGSNVKIIGCKIYNPPDSGIMYSCVQNSICRDNYIIGAPDCGVYINNNDNDDLKMGSSCSNNLIENCYTAIAMKRIAQHMTVCSNIIKNCNYAITHEEANTDTDFSTDTIISNNDIIGCGHAIILRGSNHCVVDGNKITNYKFSAISLSSSNYNIISNNAIKTVYSENVSIACYAIIIDLRKTDINCNHNNIIGNTINIIKNDGLSFSTAFISITGATDNKISDILISNNNCHGVNVGTAITLSRCENININNNNLMGTSKVISTTAVKHYIFANNRYDGNTSLMYDVPIIAILPFNKKVYQNVKDGAPTFTDSVNVGDICIPKDISNTIRYWVFQNDNTWLSN